GRPVPEVDVEAGLVTGVPPRCAATARLAHVTDQHGRELLLFDRLAEMPKERDEVGMTEVAQATWMHHLKARTIERQGLRAAQAACGVLADGAGLAGRRRLLLIPAGAELLVHRLRS